ncbi:MAG: FHA domain-containing protein [Anaerolineae bacterium]|nr:FHA domain-containing protein [Anaerolineae bacterium]
MQQQHSSYALLIETGAHTGMVLPLSGDTFTMGREIDNNLVLDSPRLSRYHARIRISPAGTVLLEDLGSTNGTFINGYLLSGVRRLKVGETFTLAGTIRLCLIENESARDFTPPEQWAVPAVEAVRYPMPGSTASPTESETWIAPALAPAIDPSQTGDQSAATTATHKVRLPQILIGLLLMALCITLALGVYLWFAPTSAWQIIFQTLGLPFPGS